MSQGILHRVRWDAGPDGWDAVPAFDSSDAPLSADAFSLMFSAKDIGRFKGNHDCSTFPGAMSRTCTAETDTGHIRTGAAMPRPHPDPDEAPGLSSILGVRDSVGYSMRAQKTALM